MNDHDVDLPRVDRATIGAIGEPGSRVFLFQAQLEGEQFTFLIEKAHAVSLAQADRAMLVQLGLPSDEPDWGEVALEVDGTQEPRWRVGHVDLTYDGDAKKVVLVLREAILEDEVGRSARFFLTRGEFASVARTGMEVATQGRPICPHCGKPKDPDGHWCVATNGHRKIQT